MRLAAPFEALRDKSDDKLKASGARPTVFLANLGTPADFTARATFAKSFFETGGIEALDTQGFADPAALAAAFKASGAATRLPVFVRQGLCGTRRRPAAKALQAAGATHIYLAGRPGEQEAALRAAGVGDFIFAGGDALATLRDAWQRMEQSMTEASNTPVLTGGCQCGAVRFALSAPPARISICHCRMCQKATGAPFASFADIEHEHFAWTRGKPATFQSSSIAERDFCAGLRHAADLSAASAAPGSRS